MYIDFTNNFIYFRNVLLSFRDNFLSKKCIKLYSYFNNVCIIGIVLIKKLVKNKNRKKMLTPFKFFKYFPNTFAL